MDVEGVKAGITDVQKAVNQLDSQHHAEDPEKASDVCFLHVLNALIHGYLVQSYGLEIWKKFRLKRPGRLPGLCFGLQVLAKLQAQCSKFSDNLMQDLAVLDGVSALKEEDRPLRKKQVCMAPSH